MNCPYHRFRLALADIQINFGKMSQLKWDKTDFLLCLGVLPEVEDYETSFRYIVERAGLVLSIAVTPYESIIEVQLQRTGSTVNLLGLSLLVGGVVEYKCEKWGKYLQLPACRIVTNRFYYQYERGTEFSEQHTLLDVEIAVDPDIRIECSR
jgi:hypothetical protein